VLCLAVMPKRTTLTRVTMATVVTEVCLTRLRRTASSLSTGREVREPPEFATTCGLLVVLTKLRRFSSTSRCPWETRTESTQEEVTVSRTSNRAVDLMAPTTHA